MAETTITAKALRSFASYVMGHGIVAGDPDAEDGKMVEVPESQVEAFVRAGYIEDPAKPKAKKGKTDPVDPAAPAGDAPPPAGDTAPPA